MYHSARMKTNKIKSIVHSLTYSHFLLLFPLFLQSKIPFLHQKQNKRHPSDHIYVADWSQQWCATSKTLRRGDFKSGDVVKMDVFTCRADPKSEFRDVLAVVLPDGTVRWVPHQIFKSSCILDVTNFPFDYQNCHMWFGSWTHTRSQVSALTRILYK